MTLQSPILLSGGDLCLGRIAVPASAEIVFLTSGRTLSVKAHRVEGESIILTLRSGGEVTCDKSLDREDSSRRGAVSRAGGRRRRRCRGAAEPARPPPRCSTATPYGEIIAAMSEAHGVEPDAGPGADPGRVRTTGPGPVAQGRHGADAADAVDRPGIQGPQPLRSQGQHRGGHQAPEGADRPAGASTWRWRRTTPARAR